MSFLQFCDKAIACYANQDFLPQFKGLPNQLLVASMENVKGSTDRNRFATEAYARHSAQHLRQEWLFF